jgi:hypothetical protein
MREWIGGRQAKGFAANGVTIVNKHYEATIEIEEGRAPRQDRQILARVRVRRPRADPLGEPAVDAAAQRRRRPSATTASTSSTPTTRRRAPARSRTRSPSTSRRCRRGARLDDGALVEEMQQSILKGIAQILSFKDDQGEPMNENARALPRVVPSAST